VRVRSGGKVVSVPVLGVVGVLPDGHKQMLALELCGGESFMAWKGCLDDLAARGLRAPVREGGDELLAFFRFPKAQWKTLRTTNVIERLHEEFRRRVKTQGSLPSEDAALILLFSLVVSGQIKLRRIDGWRKIAAVLTKRTSVAA